MPWTYPALMLVAIAVGAAISRRTQRALSLSAMERLGIGLGAFCGAFIGARLPFVLSNWNGLMSGAAWFGDGKTIVAGIVGGYFGVELAKWGLHIRVKTGDSFAVPVAAAVAIGRLACFSAGCCYGTPTTLPWGVVFSTADARPRHPTQLYESAFHIAAAAILTLLWRRGLLRGQLIKLYIISYLIYRFFSEFIRPEPEIWLGLTGYQWAAAAVAPVFIWLWICDARSSAGGLAADSNLGI
ncbi:MAG TPA: prolipoprotein diacylglyceryl transferase family protein [Pirellulales bacterium]|nr:prolipoprotein diacylglyceryl transferase family protein [Pirellulales bacterium]